MKASTLTGNLPVKDENFVNSVVLVLINVGGTVVGVSPHFSTLYVLM